MDVEILHPIQDVEKDILRHQDRSGKIASAPGVVSESPREQTLPDKEKIASAIKAVESYLHSNGTHLKFVLTDKQKMQVEIIEEDTKKLIRKIPSDEMLNLAEAIEKMTGVFMNDRV